MCEQKQINQGEEKRVLCNLAKAIIEYAVAGKVWIISCLKEFGQGNSDGIMIGGLFIRKEGLESLLERLISLQKATSDEEVDELVYEEMIPMALLYEEALWKQFQDLIDRWCYNPEPIDTSDVELPEELLALTE